VCTVAAWQVRTDAAQPRYLSRLGRSFTYSGWDLGGAGRSGSMLRVRWRRGLWIWRDRTGPRGCKVGGSVRANCPGGCQSRPSDGQRSLSRVRSEMGRVWRECRRDYGARTRERNKRQEQKGEAVQALTVTRGRYKYCRRKYSKREGAVAGLG
jgi:hypothetical protein